MTKTQLYFFVPVFVLVTACGKGVPQWMSKDTETTSDTLNETETDTETETTSDTENINMNCNDIKGICVDPFHESKDCPSGYVANADIICDNWSLICCEPQICPWDCLPNTSPLVCSDNTRNPTAIHNQNYQCKEENTVCCQPINAENGINEYCNDQPLMNCQATCKSYEEHQTNYYCPLVESFCCENLRAPCEDIEGECVSTVTCPDGQGENQGGLCDNPFETCCTAINPNNLCGLNNGTCIDWEETCPSWHNPKPTISCGDLNKMCCMPDL